MTTSIVVERNGTRLQAVLTTSQPGESEPALGLQDAAIRGRALAWQQAQALTAESSPWDLEYFKATLGKPELQLGGADALAERCATAQAGTGTAWHAPAHSLNLRSVRHALTRRGLAVRHTTLQAWGDRLHFALATAMALAMLALYLLRFARGGALPSGGESLLAVHGEWSNRTRHVLGRIGHGLSPAAIVVLGRPQMSLSAVQQRWADELGVVLPPLVVPASLPAALAAMPTLVKLLGQGMAKVAHTAYRPPLREHAALIFRVMLGAVMARWLQRQPAGARQVLLGHTGTADVCQLESALQSAGAHTVHVVHGLCTGPNFVGFSSEAVFKCGLDAEQYTALQHYGRCHAPTAPMPAPRRGAAGLLLLTNLAHPMNAGHASSGIQDELRVLRDTAELARALGPRALPLRWKPHPASQQLPAEQQHQLRHTASALGFQEIQQPAELAQAATESTWIFTTPSTMAVDLLVQGHLPVILNWQGTAFDGAISQLPCCANTPSELAHTLTRIENPADHAALFQAAWQALRPAGVFEGGGKPD